MSGRLDFWARRKALVRQEEEAEARQRQAADDAARHAAVEERSDEDVLADLCLPDPDTLRPSDDFSAFLAREVPQRLQRRALRRLWVSNPVLACVDGLNDYDGDFTKGATGNGVIRTAYQVGRGIVREAVAVQDGSVEGAAMDGSRASEPGPQVAEATIPPDPAKNGRAFDTTVPDGTARSDPGESGTAQAAEPASGRAGAPAPAATWAVTAAVSDATDRVGTETAPPMRRRMRFAFDGATTGTETG